MSTTLSATSSLFISQKSSAPLPSHPLTPLVQGIVQGMGIEFALFNDGKIIRLKKGMVVKFIQGHIFPINSSSSVAVCRDKAATSDVIKQKKIPQIRHRLFLNPTLGEWNPKDGIWPLIHAYGKKHGYQMVCKAKEGGGGKCVYRTKVLGS